MAVAVVVSVAVAVVVAVAVAVAALCSDSILACLGALTLFILNKTWFQKCADP